SVSHCYSLCYSLFLATIRGVLPTNRKPLGKDDNRQTSNSCVDVRSFNGEPQQRPQHGGCRIFTPPVSAIGAARLHWMSEIPVQVGSAITIALIVGLGVFVYPWLLAQRYGAWIVGLTTILLGALFVGFQGGGSTAYSLVLAAGWALGPVIAGVIVFRIQRKS
ncbi:MAG: hypothetical protein ACXW13_10730, partial [Burkholderiaceae bacterium]